MTAKMKSLKYLKYLLILVIYFSINCQSQTLDSLVKGNFYRFILNTGKVIEGKLLAFDSVKILVDCKHRIIEIEKKNISQLREPDFKILENYFSVSTKPEYKYIISAGGGICFPRNESEYKSDDEPYKNSLNLKADFVPFSSRLLAFRFGFTYSSIIREDYDYTYSDMYGTNNSHVAGGDLSIYKAAFDLLIGNLCPENLINGYGLAGFGIENISESSMEYTNIHRDYTNNTEYTNIGYTKPESETNFGLTIGTGLSFKLSKKLRAFTEIDLRLIFPKIAISLSVLTSINAGIMLVDF
jgi:hypothetical protein